MKKTLKIVLTVFIALVVIGGCIGGYFIWRHNTLYIDKNEALELALSHAGLERAQIFDVDIEFEKSMGAAWYELDFESQDTEYEYSIDAASGEILHSFSQPQWLD